MDAFRRIVRSTCLVCVVSGADVVRRATFPTPAGLFGTIAACGVHRPAAFCARCLRADAPHLALAPLAANERDPDLVRNGGALCAACRRERIHAELVRGRGVVMLPWMGSGFWDVDWDDWLPWDGALRSRDAARLLRSHDIAAVVSQFVDYGDWSVREAVEEMEERVWMRWWTKASEMEGLVRATARLQRIEDRAAEPDDADDDTDDDDLLSLGDEFGLREMIFQDWARNRVLQGIWLSPHVDMATYHAAAATSPEMRTLPPRVAPRHPLGRVDRTPPALPRAFPWTVVVGVRDEPTTPPRRSYIRTPANFYLSNPPPPNRLVYHLGRAWEHALRAILAPAIANVVARIVRECDAVERFLADAPRKHALWHALRSQCLIARGEHDPCKAVARIVPDRLVDILRGPEPWLQGGGWDDVRLDWDDDHSERDSLAPSPPMSLAAPSPIDAPSPDIHASSTPSPESLTSPTTPSPEALRSPSTMRTTPSPPPSLDGKKGLESDDTPAEPQRAKKPLHPIPLIPTCTYHLGHQTKLVIDQLWREATGGLWMCRCAVCVRAMSVQGVPSVYASRSDEWTQPLAQVQSEPMQIEQVVQGKGKGVVGRKSREREEAEDGGGERKRIKCEGRV
ncbi:hypothetical protein CTheo_2736 [Ceratobasidium theobromae]|uniref:Uncharacterized protein n=1 Tax=Ceratobasidium theobromae TaxID=1582974 RepID=A0A5N5QRB1_9AGAM|nr:hypothetical protein CTheo_2736 [Ceratobasidium theobromae]